MGEENFPALVPWMFDSLKTDNSNVERSGTAQGLSETKAINLKMNTCYDYEVILPEENTRYFEHVLPDIIRNCSHQKAFVRDGYVKLFKYLPRSLGVQFQNYLQHVLPAILDGLSDENESVRDAALGAGHVMVEHYATTYAFIVLPCSGTSGKALLEGGSDDEGSSNKAHGRAIIEAALHLWKTIVANTPKTFKEIMPVLMNTLISSLASTSSERQHVAARALGELVRKLGERVLPLIIPILSQGLKDLNAGRRQGVCIGLSEVMATVVKSQLLIFMDELIPTIRTALCDSMPEVRESAGLAFCTLYKSAGMHAFDEIVPTLLHALEDDETCDTALDGLKQILSVRTIVVLPHILPKLVHLPLSNVTFNAHALGALAEVAGPDLNFHLGTILPALLSAMGANDKGVPTLAKEVAETVALVIDEEGVEYLIAELLKGIGDTLVAWEALSRVIGSVPKEGLTSGSAELREQVALGLRELIEVVGEKTLKYFVIPISGYGLYTFYEI
ncbi:hypothetical protein NC651_011092 [Populus alba x Populus x berolinensis]|nr:hypothetical protein NC651_011092 [Populus alba x Populus x berolinensis]